MKCPNCGSEIPEGNMYCEKCGTEINIVPEFDPEVENKIKESLDGLSDNLGDTAEIPSLRQKIRRRKRQSPVLFYGIFAAAIVATLALCLFIFTGNDSEENSLSLNEYVSKAQSYAESGESDKALQLLRECIKAYPKESEGYFELASLYESNKDYDEAIKTLSLLLNSAVFTEDDYRRANEQTLLLYEDKGDYLAAKAFLDSSEDASLISKYQKDFNPDAPTFDLESGKYPIDTSFHITVDGDNGTIYYTIDGSKPDTQTRADSNTSDSAAASSTGESVTYIYSNELVFAEAGTYTVKAVFVNDFGFESGEAQVEYNIESDKPADIVIMEDSGNYTKATQIVASSSDGCSIYYTDDGSKPSSASKKYTSPISMPFGDSTFNFIAVDGNGKTSDVVTRKYNLTLPRNITSDQAISLVINVLVGQDVLLDTTGKVRGLDGVNSYASEQIITVQGYGEYYEIVEYHEYNDGSKEKTNYLYAVNTNDGTVCRMSYDSSGNYFLVEIKQ